MKTKLSLLILFSGIFLIATSQVPASEDLFNLDVKLESRSISFENPTGEPGEGAKAASELGAGRKGAPNKRIEPGEEVVLCDIKSPGTIRHIWMTGEWTNFEWLESKEERTELLRSTVIRVYWDGQEHPSIECPLGDFMGFAHSKVTPYQSALHSIGENGAFNFWLPMPFTEGAKITLTNESDLAFWLFYQIDYTINDAHPDDVGRLHVCFRRENPTTLKEDFELLPQRKGKGRYIGSVMGIRTLHPGWWGEGEVKIYMDGDTDFPTIAGTGSEDYVGLSYGIQNTMYTYHGCNLLYTSDSTVRALDIQANTEVDMNRQYISMYRWHLPDPIYWKEECRITIQQIGCCLYERQDDWSTATFWYEPVPSAPLPEMPEREERVEDLGELLE